MTTDAPVATASDSPLEQESVRTLWPFFVGTDNPISYLYQQIAPYFSDSEFDITVLSADSSTTIQSPNVTTVQSADYYTWSGRLSVARQAVRQHDLLHTGGIPLLHYPVSLLSKLRNPRAAHVHTYRIDVDPESERTPTGIRRRLGAQADVTTAVSQHTADSVADSFGFEPVVIYNAVNTELFHDRYDPPSLFADKPADRPAFVYVGTFEKRKRPLDVLRVAEQVTDAEFYLIGGGGEGAIDERVATEAARLDNVHLVGRVPKAQLPPIYSNADGLLFPSMMEGCPNVVLEAFASGTPVVGYEATSMPELVEHGQRGYLAAPGDIDELVNGVRLVTEGNAERLSANVRSYVLQHHTFDRIAAEYKSVYRAVLDDRVK